MDPESAIELGRDALKACLIIGGPILVLGMVVGIVIGLLQAMTQVQDQAVSFVPKILLMMVGVGLALPWLSERMVDFARASFEVPFHHQADALTNFQLQPSTFPQQPLPSEPQSEDLLAEKPFRPSFESSMPRLDGHARGRMPMLQVPGAAMPNLNADSNLEPPARVAQAPGTDF